MLSLIALLLAAPQAPADSLVVEAAGRVVVLHSRDFARLPQETIQATTHDGTTHSFTGVPLAVVLKQVGVKTDSLRGPGLAQRVVAEASDGYKVVFALGELDLTLGHREVLVADREDGKPLAAADGSWRLVVPADGRPARGAHLLVALRVRTD